MSNLLPRSRQQSLFGALSASQSERLKRRLSGLVGRSISSPDSSFDQFATLFESQLEELEEAPDGLLAEELLEEIDRIRAQSFLGDASASKLRAVSGESPADPDSGDWMFYWPGRSLATGEAEIASRGFFDVRDRPPFRFWLEAITRSDSISISKDREGVAILCWLPSDAAQRARAGRQACAAKSLSWLDESSGDLIAQLQSIMAEIAPAMNS